ncbi:MAG: UxaA family hydrolase [Bacillota bacterium]|jgi:altronate dehydratase large subunit|nr:UxaA family hydrolase [Candidatus Fermentithermobacillaceae bacterium]
MEFKGYARPDGSVGIRNHLLVLSTVACANDVAQRIAYQLNGAVCIAHEHGCGHPVPRDRDQVRRTLIGYGSNPNVGACIVVGLGCESVVPDTIADGVAKTGKPVELIVIQKEGGTINAISKGVRVGQKMLVDLAKQERETHDLSKITLGLECGGSDTTSGLIANPALGVASDLLIAHGGTSILSETPEIVGGEHLLARRAASPEVAQALLDLIKRTEERFLSIGANLSNLAPGNVEGGLSTVEDKSLGCVLKAGSAPLQEVIGYACKPTKRGLIVMDTPGYDIESITGMVAGGAQIVVFTTGRGTPAGCPIAPVIKVTGNPATYRNMEENIDVNAGRVLEDGATIQEIGQEIFDLIVRVCNREMVKAERLGYGGFAITRAAWSG